MQTTMSLHEVRWFFKTSFSRVLLFFSAARVNRRLANVSGSDLILLLIQCELAGQPSDESRMNHSHDSRSKTEAHRPTSFFFFTVQAKKLTLAGGRQLKLSLWEFIAFSAHELDGRLNIKMTNWRYNN